MTKATAEHFHTTIKVRSDLRDRLKAQAEAHQLTIGEHLTRLADLADRESRYQAVARAMAATPPEQMASYIEETEFWDRAAGG